MKMAKSMIENERKQYIYRVVAQCYHQFPSTSERNQRSIRMFLRTRHPHLSRELSHCSNALKDSAEFVSKCLDKLPYKDETELDRLVRFQTKIDPILCRKKVPKFKAPSEVGTHITETTRANERFS